MRGILLYLFFKHGPRPQAWSVHQAVSWCSWTPGHSHKYLNALYKQSAGRVKMPRCLGRTCLSWQDVLVFLQLICNSAFQWSSCLWNTFLNLSDSYVCIGLSCIHAPVPLLYAGQVSQGEGMVAWLAFAVFCVFSAPSPEGRLPWGVSSSPVQPWSWEVEVLKGGGCGEE